MVFMSNELYKSTVGRFLNGRDSETWHDRARDMLHILGGNSLSLFLLEKLSAKATYNTGRLATSIGGVHFDNPLIVGAGWDKKGSAVRGLHALGFAGVEVGTVVKRPQIGNEKPRQFMVGDGVALNRLGFNSPGMNVVAENLAEYQKSGIPIGVSLGKNKETSAADAPEEHAAVARALYEYASYFVINVSSPNTPGLRELQDKSLLTDNVHAVNEAMDERGKRIPLLVKVAPDLTKEALDAVIEVVTENNLTGIIAANTTINADLKEKYGRQGEMGGLSGDDETYRRMTTLQVAHIYTQAKQAGKLIEIIGVGGVKDAATAYEKLAAGANAVQVVTAIRGEGPLVAKSINQGLLKKFKQEGITSVQEVVGTQAHQY
jgi:dihydroorotate dehydrogenase